MAALLLRLLLLWISLFFARAATPQDISALREFASKIGINDNYWNFSGEPCSDKWVGISCCSADSLESLCCVRKFSREPSCSTMANATIVAINLDSTYEPVGFERLSGVLDESICNLTSLTTLDVNNNNLTGTIPTCIGASLTRLRFLGLAAGNLSGSIPQQLGELKMLQEIYLDNNVLSGSIPASFGGLESLKVLSLRGNMLSGQIPAELGSLSNLTTLQLQVNQLNGSIPTSLSNLTKLTTLQVFNNQLSGSLRLSTFQSISGLLVLDAHMNSFTGSLPAFDETFANLTRLDLSFNKFSGDIPASLGRMPSLQTLFLGHNNLSGGIPSSFTSRKTLGQLDISHNSLTGSLENLPQQVQADFSFNAFESQSLPLQQGMRVSYFNCESQQPSCRRSSPGKFSSFDFHVTGTPMGTPTSDPVLNTTGFSYFRENWALEQSGASVGTYSSRAVAVSDNGDNVELYQSMRWSSSYLAYHGANLENGIYAVTMYFAETLFPYPDYRVFNVLIQGEVVERNLDVVQRVGAYTGLRILKNATVRDGSLSIEFINTGKDRYFDPKRYQANSTGAMVSAISVRSLNPKSSSLSWKIITVIVVLSSVVIITLAGILCYYRRSRRQVVAGGGSLSRDTGLRAYAFEELYKATDGFSERQKLGQGGFGKVHLGVIEGNQVAVKQLTVPTQQSKKAFRKEMKILRSVQHRNILSIRGYSLDSEHPMLVCDYMPNGSLDKLLYAGELTWQQRHKIAIGGALGLTYLHEESKNRIVHCDVKPPNILLDDELNPRIGDFGMARLYEEGVSHVTATRMGGTIGYLAPEYAMHYQLSDKADVYSYGVVILELVSGRRAIESGAPADQVVLVEWAHSLASISKDELAEMVDERLLRRGDLPMDQVIRAASVGVLCTQELPSLRPGIRSVWLMLIGTVDVPEISPSSRRHDALRALWAAYGRSGTFSSDRSALSISPR